MAFDFAIRCVLGDLVEVNAVARPGMRAFLAQYAKGAPSRFALSGAGGIGSGPGAPRGPPRMRQEQTPGGGARPPPARQGQQVQAATNSVIANIRVEVRDMIAAAKSAGCRFVVQGDTWQPRTRRGGTYAVHRSPPRSR